jgi:hypothetical protein
MLQMKDKLEVTKIQLHTTNNSNLKLVKKNTLLTMSICKSAKGGTAGGDEQSKGAAQPTPGRGQSGGECGDQGLGRSYLHAFLEFSNLILIFSLPLMMAIILYSSMDL